MLVCGLMSEEYNAKFHKPIQLNYFCYPYNVVESIRIEFIKFLPIFQFLRKLWIYRNNWCQFSIYWESIEFINWMINSIMSFLSVIFIICWSLCESSIVYHRKVRIRIIFTFWRFTQPDTPILVSALNLSLVILKGLEVYHPYALLMFFFTDLEIRILFLGNKNYS